MAIGKEPFADGAAAPAEIAGIPIAPEILLTDKKGKRKGGIEKRQTRLVNDVAGFVKPFLKPGERVWLVTTGCSPMSFLEQYLTGWIIFYLKRALFIFTDQRILHVPTTSSFKYRNCIARINYADCSKIKVSMGSLVVTYKSGKSEKFYYIQRSERGKLKAIFEQLSLDAASPSADPRRAHLCPRCTGELAPEVYRCPSCQLEFKDRATARKIAILWPGGGYFYLGHPWLGVADAIAETFLIVVLIAAVARAIQGEEFALAEVIIWAIALAIEKAVSVFHSNHYVREFLPKDKLIQPLRTA
ncbi:MAG: hypothetical protein JXR83_19395 [Deltaproteobacteria bacterium]|nr:hypothetical protein [Deltaproteobacteria bacterium]